MFSSSSLFKASEHVATTPASLNLTLASLTRISKKLFLERALSGFSEIYSSSTLVAMNSLSMVENPTFLSRILHESANIEKSIQEIFGNIDRQAIEMKISLSLAKFS